MAVSCVRKSVSPILIALLGNQLDVQLVRCDRVVHCSLDTFAECSVLVEQGKPERAVC